jgi:hypothetical protein
VHCAGSGRTLRHHKPLAEAGNDLVPLDEGAAGRASRRRKEGDEATTGFDNVQSQLQVPARVHIVEAGRDNSHLRNPASEGSTVSNGIRTERKPRHKHIKVWVKGIDDCTEQRGVLLVDLP